MKYSVFAIASLLLADQSMGFAPPVSRTSSKTFLNMAVDMPPPPPPPAAQETAVVKKKELPTITPNAYGQPTSVRYSDFLRLVDADKIEKVTFSADGGQLLGVDVDGTRIKIDALPNDPDLLSTLNSRNIDVTVLPTQEASGLGDLAQSLIFPAVLFAGLFFLSRRSGEAGGGIGGPGGAMGFGKSKAQIDMVPDTGISFNEVAGCDGAKLELEEVVDFLKRPEAYTKNGCRIPRGVILDGPPGTGKTLLAKAVAGEAGVPFISISGSEFVEMFVGVGASRVRDVFSQAKKNAPCIIFIDEIDAVARQRGAGYAGGNDEREQTVNQILVEMDGFVGNPGIIVIAATNRVDIIDNALLRPGRFDRKITVDLPDYKGRGKILGVHSRGKPLEPDVDLLAIARRTPGFSGAQLENLMNEAAITAARAGKATIGWEEIDSSVDRMMVGLEKKGKVDQKTQEVVAYHEAGHAVVGALVPDYDMVQKITIIPRSNGAGGLTFFSPQEDRLEAGFYTRQYLESQLAVALGGRLAEEIIYGEVDVTTGASNDIQQVASIATAMVKEYGMSKLGPIAITEPGGRRPFMGMRMLQQPTTWSNDIVGEANLEIERLVINAYTTAKKVLNDNIDLLHHLAKVLVEQETVSAEEFQMMLVEFNAKTTDWAVFSDDRDREKLPFKVFPEPVGV